MIPYTTIYRYNHIALNTNTIKNSIDIKKNINNVIPTQNTLIHTNFNTHINIQTLITVTQNKKPIPFKSLIQKNNTEITNIINNNKQIYLNNTPLSNKLLIQ